MIHTETTVRTLQAVAMTVGLAVFLWSTGLPTLFYTVEAASITSASDTLSNSAPGANSVHTIQFTTPNGLSVGQIFSVEIQPEGANQFNLSNLTIDSISMTVNGNATNTAVAAGVGAWGVSTGTDSGTQFIVFETPTDAPGKVASSSVLVLTIGSELGNMITNPSGVGATTSYQVGIGTDTSTTTMQDSGNIRIAIVDEVTVSASVDTSLTFTVSGTNFGADANGSPTSTSATTTSTSLPFGTLNIDTSETLAQRLNVSTNAANGYSVTIEQATELQSSTGADINGFIDGNWTTTPTAWQGPTADASDDTTYGHWGITSTDGTTTRSSEFTQPDTWIAASTTPVVIMGHDGPSNGVVEGVGSSTIGFQIEISALQEAGDDYSTTLRYIATPTF